MYLFFPTYYPCSTMRSKMHLWLMWKKKRIEFNQCRINPKYSWVSIWYVTCVNYMKDFIVKDAILLISNHFPTYSLHKFFQVKHFQRILDKLHKMVKFHYITLPCEWLFTYVAFTLTSPIENSSKHTYKWHKFAHC